MTNTVDTALRADIVGLLGLVQTFNGQLIPENTEDFLSDWTSTVEQLEALISSLTNEAELRGREKALKSVLGEAKKETWDTSKEYADGWNQHRSKVVTALKNLKGGVEKHHEQDI